MQLRQLVTLVGLLAPCDYEVGLVVLRGSKISQWK